MIKIARTKNELQEVLSAAREKGSIGFVPTMGALHQGHLSLIERSRDENEITVVSIYVNPTQFNDKTDLKNYPRDPENDIRKAGLAGANVAFLPDDRTIYPEQPPQLLDIDLGNLDNILEGQFRPGHFRGVVTVVKRLFDLVHPHKAYFGLKDYQQLLVIKKLVSHFHLPIEIVSVPTVREEDGLAMSSRNLLLSTEERLAAPFIYRQLLNAQTLLAKMTVSEVKKEIISAFEKNNMFKLEYFEIRDAETLEEINEIKGKAVMLVAAWLGNVRLIDNLLITK